MIIKDQKEQNRKISYEDITTKLESRPDMIYYIEHEKIDPYNGYNRCIETAAREGHADIVELLLNDKRMTPSIYPNQLEIRGKYIGLIRSNV